MSDNPKFNTNLAVEAEYARQERDGEPEAQTVRVKAVEAVSIAGKAHDAGATFTAPVEAVRDAIARGLVEPSQAPAKSKR